MKEKSPRGDAMRHLAELVDGMVDKDGSRHRSRRRAKQLLAEAKRADKNAVNRKKKQRKHLDEMRYND